jgi:pyrroline-5-carboxylate reductase
MSVLAGVNIKTLKSKIKSKHYIRVMPNIGAKFGSSFTLLTGDIETKRLSMNIFDKIGNSMWLDSEDEIDIGTSISGSGPAYLALVAEAIIDGAIGEGMDRDKAKGITIGLFDSYIDILKRYEPQEIVKMVSSPAGTTVAGCKVLTKYDINKIFIETISSATKRAKELSSG